MVNFIVGLGQNVTDFQVSCVDMWLVGRLRGQRGECSGGGMNTGSKMEWDRCLWENIGTGKWRRIDQLGRRGCASPACAPHTHTYSYSRTSVGSENEIFQAAISAANSITEGTCTKSCDFPDGEIGKG